MKTSVLFVHGGGDEAYRYDRELGDRLQAALGPNPRIDLPLIAGLEALDWDATRQQLGDAFRALPAGAVVMAHSIGGAAALKLLSSGLDPKLGALLLLAPPYTADDGEWAHDVFSFPANFADALPKTLPIRLWHGADDTTITPDSARRYAQKLPAAQITVLEGYGHQFEGPLGFLADAVREAAS